jgi:hypothetical protein
VVLKCRHFGAPGGNSKLVTASAETVLDRATVLPLLPDGPAALVPLTSRTTLLASSRHRFVAPTRARNHTYDDECLSPPAIAAQYRCGRGIVGSMPAASSTSLRNREFSARDS